MQIDKVLSIPEKCVPDSLAVSHKTSFHSQMNRGGK